MARINLQSGDIPEILITTVAGSLQLKGWDEENIQIDVQREEDLGYTFEDDSLELSSQGDCIVRVPEGGKIAVKAVRGNAVINNIENEIGIEEVNGSLTLKNVGATTVERVGGNLNARNVEGDLSVKSVGGSATFRSIEGDLSAQDVGGNASVRDIEGEVDAHCHGNAELAVEPEGDVQVKADGNLYCHVDDGADVDVSFKSGAQHIQLYTETGRQIINAKSHKFTMGDGGMDMDLSAGGHIDFRSKGASGDFNFNLELDPDLAEEFSDLADDITAQIGTQMEGQLEALNEQLTSLGERLRHSGSRAAAEAQRHVEKAQRKLASNLRDRRRSRVVTVTPHPKSEPVSTKERSLILQMLQDKKVSVEEAEMLLNTLEGRPVSHLERAAEETPQEATEKSDQAEGKEEENA